MSYQKDRDEFVAVITEECSRKDVQAAYRQAVLPENRRGSSWEMARLILRNANTIQRIATKACNEELSAHDERSGAACCARIRDACKPWGIKPNFQGDPRGCCVKLLLPSGRWNSMGGAEDGYCVPTR